jgi:hypothetical protein
MDNSPEKQKEPINKFEFDETVRLARRINGIAVAHIYRSQDVYSERWRGGKTVAAFPTNVKRILILGDKESVAEFSNSIEDFKDGFYQHI